MTDGKTYDEAVKNAEVAIQEWIDTAAELGREVPVAKGKLAYAGCVSSVALTRNFVRIPDIVTKEPPPSATPGVDFEDNDQRYFCDSHVCRHDYLSGALD